MSVLRYRPETKAFLLSVAACVVLIIGMGYGRFAFTGILPVMLHEHLLSLTEANLAASANYAGYLAGALMLAKARPADARNLCAGSVLASLACLVALAWLQFPPGIILVRGLAGIFSAISLVSASLWLLQHMKHAHGAPLMYAGVGLGIFISAECIALGKSMALSSQAIWSVCAVSAGLLYAIIFRLLNSPPDTLIDYHKPDHSTVSTEGRTRSAAMKLLAVYGLAGFGYIITATYLPLFLTGSLAGIDPVHVWAIFGLAAVPSCFVWHRIVLSYGYRRSLMLNLFIQSAGVLLPVFSHGLIFCLASALLVGFTFMGTVTIAMPRAKYLADVVNFNMIAAMTALYGIGQIAGPLIAGELYAVTRSFNPSLITAAISLLVAGFIVAFDVGQSR
ncbi:YbfB/YjiJ family MFS transporter [Mangrovibacter yixingensis]|uniref:YbfB/YjiJ family MFS transporter n=1 Tax=Mangrovibacter yixingensis TaxID=1529639 RepID=UPI001CF96734|nr:YbfB/YjiJ family MFS transporter [Mangrovibacter yixingensis]